MECVTVCLNSAKTWKWWNTDVCLTTVNCSCTLTWSQYWQHIFSCLPTEHHWVLSQFCPSVVDTAHCHADDQLFHTHQALVCTTANCRGSQTFSWQNPSQDMLFCSEPTKHPLKELITCIHLLLSFVAAAYILKTTSPNSTSTSGVQLSSKE